MRRTLIEIYADPAMVTPERVKRFAELQRFPGNRQATLQRARTQEPLDPTPLKRLDVPTLIIWGAQGPLGAGRRRLPLPERHQGRQARDLREARPQPDGRGAPATAAAVAAFLPPIPNEPASANSSENGVIAVGIRSVAEGRGYNGEEAVLSALTNKVCYSSGDGIYNSKSSFTLCDRLT